MVNVGVGFRHDRILAVVMGECVAIEIAVLEALGLAPPDTLHALAAFLCLPAATFRLLLAGADAPWLEAAALERVGYDCLGPLHLRQ